jgi:hypothetical protein
MHRKKHGISALEMDANDNVETGGPQQTTALTMKDNENAETVKVDPHATSVFALKDTQNVATMTPKSSEPHASFALQMEDKENVEKMTATSQQMDAPVVTVQVQAIATTSETNAPNDAEGIGATKSDPHAPPALPPRYNQIAHRRTQEHSWSRSSTPSQTNGVSTVADLGTTFQSMSVAAMQQRAPATLAHSPFPGYYNAAYYQMGYPLAMDYHGVPQYSSIYPPHSPVGCACPDCAGWNMHYSHLHSAGYAYRAETTQPWRHKQEHPRVPPKSSNSTQSVKVVQTDVSDLEKPVIRQWKRDENVKEKSDTAYCKDARKVEDLLLAVSGAEECHAIVVLGKILERNPSIRSRVLENLKCHRLDTMIVDGLKSFVKDRCGDGSADDQLAIDTVTYASFFASGKQTKYGEIADRLSVPLPIAKKCKRRALESKKENEITPLVDSIDQEQS